jgi:aldehyde dehydrogenase (NAD+)/retinal dehydrogenase
MFTTQKVLDPKSYTKIYLNGEYVSTHEGRTYSLKNPKDNSLVTDSVPIAGAADVDLAVEHAEKALNGPWSKISNIERTQCFHRLAALVEEEMNSILTLDSLTGRYNGTT